MLTELKVSNFAIIDKVDVVFTKGFNVLSGETGSGKSVLLKSLALLMGEKSVSDAIKMGAEQAIVEGAFDLSSRADIRERLIALGLSDGLPISENMSAKVKKIASDEENTLIVRRVISTDGKNRVYVNGRLSALQQLREIVAPLIEVTGHPAPLIEMTGQHENRNLQSKSYHLEMLDQYLGTSSLRRELEELYGKATALKAQIAELDSQSREKSQRLDYLTFQRNEIRGLNLVAGEEVELEKNIRLARESSKLHDYVDQAEQVIYSDDDSVLARLHRIIQRGHDFAKIDSRLEKQLETLGNARSAIEESMFDLRDFAKKFAGNQNQIEDLESRLSQLRKLQKKFGPTTQDILTELTRIENEIATLEHSDELREESAQQLSQILNQAQKIARDLHEKRLKGADTFSKSVNAELSELNMKGVVFGVDIRIVDLNSTGISEVEFVIQSSKNDSRRALAKFASGGELSRILLSIKRVTGASEFPRTYLFDEVDAGVSGVTAEKVGRKLKAIAKGQQVICVTHLPQVAAFADSHFSIAKSASKSGSMTMRISELDKEDKVREIARMLSGEKITQASLANAKELLRG